MMASKMYHAVLMDQECELVAEVDAPVNARYFVLVPVPEGAAIMAGDDEPQLDDLPVGSMAFHRLGSAVHTSDHDASSLYEWVGQRS